MFRSVLLLVWAATAFLLASSCAADDTPELVAEVGRKIEVETKTILRFAHPRGAFKKTTIGKARKEEGDYVVPLTVEWTGKGDEKGKGEVKDFTTVFDFTVRLDKDGKIDGIGVAVSKDSCPVEAFKGSGIAVRALRVFVKSSPPGKAIEILKPKLYEQIDKMDAPELLCLYLQFTTERRKKPAARIG
jgi:hypothetical protein